MNKTLQVYNFIYAYKLIQTVSISSILVYYQVFFFSAALVGNLWCKLKQARILCFRIALIFNLPTTADNLVLLQTDTNKQEGKKQNTALYFFWKHFFLQLRFIETKQWAAENQHISFWKILDIRPNIRPHI